MEECVLVWSEEVQPTVMALSAPKLIELSEFCYLLMYRAEFFRKHPQRIIIRLGRAEGINPEDLPLAAFRKHGHWFRLEMTTNSYYGQREYALRFATAPPSEQPGADEGDDAGAGLETGEKTAKNSSGDGSYVSARAAKMSKPRRINALQNLFISYIPDNLSAAGFLIWSHLARSIQLIRESANQMWRLGLEWAQNLDVCLQSINAARGTIRALIEAQSLGAVTPVSKCGRLEPRLFGQNLGVHFLLHTMVFEEQIDWNADLFGVLDHEGEQAAA